MLKLFPLRHSCNNLPPLYVSILFLRLSAERRDVELIYLRVYLLCLQIGCLVMYRRSVNLCRVSKTVKRSRSDINDAFQRKALILNAITYRPSSSVIYNLTALSNRLTISFADITSCNINYIRNWRHYISSESDPCYYVKMMTLIYMVNNYLVYI